MDENQNIERQAVILRWVAIAVTALMLAGAVPWQAIAAGVGLASACNALLMATAAKPAVWARRLHGAAWVLDTLLASLAVGISLHTVPSLYFLYVLIIMEAGYVALSTRKVAMVTAACMAGNLAATAAFYPKQDIMVFTMFITTHSIALAIAAGMAVTIAIFKNRDNSMARRDRKLSSLLDFGTRLTSSEDVGRLMEQTLRVAIKDTGASAGFIMLVDEASGDLVTEVAFSVGEAYPFPERRAPGEGIEGYVAQTGRPLQLAHEKELRTANENPAVASLCYDGEAALCVPLVESKSETGAVGTSRIIGTFSLFNHCPGGRFLGEDLDLVRTIAGLTTMAIVNSRLYQNQRKSFFSSLQALARTLDAKDAYTQGHSYRVSELCVMMAMKLQIAPEMIDELRNGALLHDIGKIGIPDAVLSKPGRLSDEEFEIMKSHPVIGYEICQPLGLGDGILMLIRNHHEKLDGTGYPDGLKLGELPLLLRIICAADAFDAMSSSRPYRKSMDTQVRNEQLNRFAGTQFDPIIIETLKSLLRNGELDELYKDQWAVEEEDPAAPDASLLRAA